MSRCSITVDFIDRIDGYILATYDDIDAIIPFAGKGGHPGVLLRDTNGRWYNLDSPPYTIMKLDVSVYPYGQNKPLTDVATVLGPHLGGLETVVLLDSKFTDRDTFLRSRQEGMTMLVAVVNEINEPELKFTTYDHPLEIEALPADYDSPALIVDVSAERVRVHGVSDQEMEKIWADRAEGVGKLAEYIRQGEPSTGDHERDDGPEMEL